MDHEARWREVCFIEHTSNGATAITLIGVDQPIVCPSQQTFVVREAFDTWQLNDGSRNCVERIVRSIGARADVYVPDAKWIPEGDPRRESGLWIRISNYYRTNDPHAGGYVYVMPGQLAARDTEGMYHAMYAEDAPTTDEDPALEPLPTPFYDYLRKQHYKDPRSTDEIDDELMEALVVLRDRGIDGAGFERLLAIDAKARFKP